jgi:hypothetical protein
MKKIVIFCICLSFKLIAQNKEKKIEIDYIGYEVENGSKISYIMKFEIFNLTKDTLYLSKENFKLRVFNKETVLEKEEIKKSDLHIQIKKSGAEYSVYKFIFERWNSTKNLREKYSEKLVNNNEALLSLSDNDKKALKLILSNACIVLMPNDKIVYANSFNNSIFNNSYNVELNYDVNKPFYSFEENNKTFKIKN